MNVHALARRTNPAGLNLKSVSLVALLLALCLWLMPTQASATNFLVSTSYWYDADNEASLDQARQAAYTPYVGVLSQGYQPGTSWVRARIRGVDPSEDIHSLILWISPTYLNEVTLFDPLMDWKPAQTGDVVTEPSILVRPTNLGFRIPVSTSDRDIYLRMRSTSTHLLSIEVLTQDEFLIADGFRVFWHGLFFGGLFLVALWAIFEWSGKRDKLVGRFVLKHLAVTIYSIGYLGYLTYLFTPSNQIDSPDTIFSYSMFVLLVVALQFHIAVLKEYGLTGARLKIVKAFYLLPLMEFVLAMTNHMQLALKLNAVAVMLMPVVVLLLVLLHRKSDRQAVDRPQPSYLSRKTLLTYYGLIVVVLVAGSTQIIGLIHGGELVLHAFLFHSFISSILIMTMLQLRARHMERQHRFVSREVARTQGELTAERLAREEQGRMVEMLSHEIKTPLSVLQLAVEEWIREKGERQLADRSIQEIKTVVERSIVASKRASAVEISEPIDLSETIREQIGLTGCVERFSVTASPGLTVTSNRLMVEQMVSNLIDNALKYGARATQIRIEATYSSRIQLEREQSGIAISIRNAIGCAGKPDASMVFKKYYRAEAAKSQAGTGVGLFLVQQFARYLGGAVQYKPSQTEIEFILWLPANISSS